MNKIIPLFPKCGKSFNTNML